MLQSRLLRFSFLFFFALNLYAQQPCAPGTSIVRLDINNVDAMLLNGGDMWWDFNLSRYEVPAGSDQTALFAGAIWMGGVNGNGDLHLASQMYRQVGNDYFPGPLNDHGTTAAEDCAAYNRHWKVARSVIDDFKTGALTEIPSSILDWPAKGNPNAPTDVTTLAPFTDVNGDGLYNPEDGDYPQIKGDLAVWWVINDAGAVHSNSGGRVLGVEIHVMAYAYQSDDDIDNSTFYNYTVINKSGNTYEDFYLGVFTDVDLGFGMDDYIGCNPSLDLAYGYNADAFDDENFGRPGYGTELPVMGIKILQGPKADDGTQPGMNSFGYMETAGNLGVPNTAAEYYNRLQGLWNDGTPYTEGGNGTSSTQPVTTFIYPGNPGDGADWSECSNGNTVGDRRFIQTMGPLTLEPFKPVSFTYSAIFSQENAYMGTCPDLTTYFDVVEDVQDFHDSTHCTHFQPQLLQSVIDVGDGIPQLEVIGPNRGSSYYQWSTGELTETIEPGTSGTYSVTVTDDFGCSTVLSEEVEVEPASIRDGSSGYNPIRIFPNPSSDGIFNLQNNAGMLEINVFDMLGNSVWRGQVDQSLDLSHQPSGVYFVQLSDTVSKDSFRLMITR